MKEEKTIREKTLLLMNKMQFFEDVAPLLYITKGVMRNLCYSNGNKTHNDNLHRLLDAQLAKDEEIRNIKVNFEEIIKTK